MAKWFQVLCDIFQSVDRTREVFDYALQATGSLLGNHIMFVGEDSYVRTLLGTVTDWLTVGGTALSVDSRLSRTDADTHLVQILATLASYHEQFTREQIRGLVSTLDKTAGSRGHAVSIECIHALTICCYEVPSVMSSNMDGILNKMSRLVTQQHLAIHTLHFLAGLSRFPELYRNFTESDYRRVFGVCASYLTSARGQHSTNERKRTPTSERSSTTRDEDALPEYVYALAHHVITFWFMALKMEDRPKQIPWITKNLHYTDSSGKQVMEEQGQVILDIMNMVAYTDRDETTREESSFKPGDGEVWKKTWIVGNALVTIETAARTGASVVTTRRPVSCLGR